MADVTVPEAHANSRRCAPSLHPRFTGHARDGCVATLAGQQRSRVLTEQQKQGSARGPPHLGPPSIDGWRNGEGRDGWMACTIHWFSPAWGDAQRRSRGRGDIRTCSVVSSDAVACQPNFAFHLVDQTSPEIRAAQRRVTQASWPLSSSSRRGVRTRFSPLAVQAARTVRCALRLWSLSTHATTRFLPRTLPRADSISQRPPPLYVTHS